MHNLYQINWRYHKTNEGRTCSGYAYRPFIKRSNFIGNTQSFNVCSLRDKSHITAVIAVRNCQSVQSVCPAIYFIPDCRQRDADVEQRASWRFTGNSALWCEVLMVDVLLIPAVVHVKSSTPHATINRMNDCCQNVSNKLPPVPSWMLLNITDISTMA